MRVLAADDGVDLNDFALEVQAFEIVGNAEQVDFRRKLISRVAPIGICENSELTASNECFQTILNFFEVSRGGKGVR